jgi:predicted anti-sigma-YlaC factor YlaD
MTCQDATMSLGVYLLGALEPAEQAEVDAHLAHCSDCQQQLAELAALPSMLERLELADLEPTLADHEVARDRLIPSEDLFSRVAAQVRDEESVVRRVRFGRFQKLTAAAAAVVVIAGVGIAVAIGHHGDSGSHVFVGDKGPIHMRVEVNDQASSTTLHVAVAGLPQQEHCWLIAVSSDGVRDQAGQWDATYGGTAAFTGSTSIPLSQLSRLVLLGSNHQPLDTVTV